MNVSTPLILIVLLTGCSSVQLVENSKNPDIVLFHASKVLIVGMTQNEEVRQDFETQMLQEFERRGIESMRSIDLFDVKFSSAERSEEELDEVEQQLLDKDFDAIFFSKVVGSEDRTTLDRRLGNYQDYYSQFRDDYLDHQWIYYEGAPDATYKVYHAETSLYCICVGKERQWIWTGSLDITDPGDIEKAVKDYIKIVVLAMEEQDLIFRKKGRQKQRDFPGQVVGSSKE